VRRIVATLLVVASPLLMAVPVNASDIRPVGPTALPAAPDVVPTPAPVAVTPPAVPAVVRAPALGAPSPPAAVHTAVRALRAKVPGPAEVNDAAYAARLQAELCRARQIFCGLDHGGRYPTR